jgi:AcrR family transcriptional regulator
MTKRVSSKASVGVRSQGRLREVPMPRPAARPKEMPSGPRSGKGERTRERLLEAAKKVFEEHGFLNARVDDIVTRAELSHGNFYYYFDSKEAAFRAIAAALDERLFAPLDEVILAESGLPHGQRIREAARRYLEYYRREARMMDLIEQVSRYDPEINALRLAHHKRNTERVAESIRQQQLRGAADPQLDPLIVATALGALTQRFAELWFVQGVLHCTFERGVDQLSRIYENALRANAPKSSR